MNENPLLGAELMTIPRGGRVEGMLLAAVVFAFLVVVLSLAACHGKHHHGLPSVLPCPDKDSASDTGEGHHQHDPCEDEEDD